MPALIVQELVENKSNIAKIKPASRHIFFANLNGLRFLAALVVIVSHVESGRVDKNLPGFLAKPEQTGQMGVTLFFVLSGFLITYLLLAEKEQFDRINFKAFYMRRILRIWPLYYAVILLGLFVLPHIEFFDSLATARTVYQNIGTKSLLFALVLPNVVKELYPTIPYLTQSWSIGVEEQFYIGWPVLVYYSRNYIRNFLLLAGIVYVIGQLSWFLTVPSRHILPINEATTFFKNFMFFFRIQSMAIGGLSALILFKNWTKTIKVLTAPILQYIIWGLVIVMLVRGQTIPYVAHEVYSLIFGILVLNLAITHTSVVNLRHPVLDYLGRISYGLYMLHLLAITLAAWVTGRFLVVGDSLAHSINLLITVLISVALATFSYYFLEMPFLNLKKRFTRVKSGS